MVNFEKPIFILHDNIPIEWDNRIPLPPDSTYPSFARSRLKPIEF
jgi:hypothetical protein